MADSTLSALTELASVYGAEELYVNDGGVSKKVALGNVNGGIYPVTDTAIADHGNAATVGSIAYQLATAETAGGGVVFVSQGTFTVTNATPLNVGAGVSLVGSGKDATIIDHNHVTANCIEVDTGTGFKPWKGKITDLRIDMPTGGTAGDGITLAQTQSGEGNLERLLIQGGDAANWGIVNLGCNQTNVLDVYINGSGNGLRFYNVNAGAINYGDCFVHGLEVTLDTNSTTGIYMEGDSNGSINNIMFGRTEIKVANSRTGCTGIHLAAYVTRNSFYQTDIENCATGINIAAATVFDNDFIATQDIGLTTALTLTGAAFQDNRFMGGSGDFLLAETVQQKGKTILTKASSVSVTYADHGGKSIVNSGAVGTVTYTLPAADNDLAYEFEFFVNTAQPIALALTDAADRIIDPNGTQRTSWTSTGVAGEFIRVTNRNFKYWTVESQIGTWS